MTDSKAVEAVAWRKRSAVLSVRAHTESALDDFMQAAQAIGWPMNPDIDDYNSAVIAAYKAHLEAEGMVVIRVKREERRPFDFSESV